MTAVNLGCSCLDLEFGIDDCDGRDVVMLKVLTDSLRMYLVLVLQILDLSLSLLKTN